MGEAHVAPPTVVQLFFRAWLFPPFFPSWLFPLLLLAHPSSCRSDDVTYIVTRIHWPYLEFIIFAFPVSCMYIPPIFSPQLSYLLFLRTLLLWRLLLGWPLPLYTDALLCLCCSRSAYHRLAFLTCMASLLLRYQVFSAVCLINRVTSLVNALIYSDFIRSSVV